MPDRPNILFLMSDEHRRDVAGFAGNDVIRTPVLDELARTGVTFTNAYTPSPICVPGRQCIMSGQLPKTCGCEGWTDLQPNYMTFARQFSRYAYQTVCAGKLHHQGPDQMQGWTHRIAGDVSVATNFIPDRVEAEFEKLSNEPGTGKWSNQKEVERAGVANGPYQRFDRFARDATLNWIEDHYANSYYDRPSGNRPVLYKLSLLQPHYPFFTTEELFRYYLNRVPIYDEQPCDHPVLSLSQQNKPVNVTPRDIRRATAAYYGMVETIDGYYGDVMRGLEDVGQNLDDWIIVYTSDHGEMLGQHGIWEKTRFYEASVGVPLIIRWPRGFKGGRTIDANVSLCDLFATLCDLAGLDTPPGLDSRSLAALLRSEDVDWSNEVVAQQGKQHVMIKQDALKYQYYGPDIPEVLFDLDADPGESTNVIDQPQHAAAVSRFRGRLASLGHGPNADAGYVNAGYA